MKRQSRVRDTMLPRAEAKELKKEPHYSPTRLLAADDSLLHR